MAALTISEIFHSIQGESTTTGLRTAFVRLTGCDLRCSYCDTAHAFYGGTRMEIDEILRTVSDFQVKHVLITGGEPLLQENTKLLAKSLAESGYFVSVETHGQRDFSAVREWARIIMDVKTPGSGEFSNDTLSYMRLLRAGDEIKFVIAAESDFGWAKEFLETHSPAKGVEILFSPAWSAPERGTSVPLIELDWLAEKVLESRLNVRIQVQLHKYIWGPEKKGV